MLKNKNVLLLSLFALLLIGNVSAALTDDLDIYWNLDQASGTITDSVGSIDMRPEGSPVYGEDGIIKQAITWDSADDIWRGADTLGVANFSNTDDFTYNFWLNRTASGNNRFFLTSQNYSFQTGMGCGTNANVRTYCAFGNQQVLDVGHNLNEWYMFTFVRNNSGNDIYVYINGVQNDSYTAGALIVNSSTFNFGDSRLDQSLAGVILDEVGVWSRAITQTEIDSLYNSGNGFNPITEVTLNSPAEAYNSTVGLVNFNGSVAASTNVANVSLIVNGTYNQTNTTGSNNVDYLFNATFPIGYYNWTYEMCDTSSSCTNATFRTFTISEIIEDWVNYTASAYDTDSETFMINVSANSSLTSATLVYDGTSYSSTKTGNNFSATIVLDGTGSNDFYWNFTYAGRYISSATYNQNVSDVQLLACNATTNVTFLNLTFLDEETLLPVNATIDTSTFYYWLGDGTVYRTYIYTNTSTNNGNYSFCFNPAGRTLNNNRSIQYAFTGYPQRKYIDTTSLTNETTNKTLYLLATADGIYSTVQALDANGQVISGVSVTVERQFSGAWTIIGQDVTDSAGSATFWVNPDFDHRYTFTKTNCTTLQVTIRPTQTNYLANMQCTGVAQVTNVYASPVEGVRYNRFPAPGVISPGAFNFTFIAEADNDNFVSARFEIVNATNGTVLLSATSSCSSSKCVGWGQYTVSDGDYIKGRYYVDIGGGEILLEGDAFWKTINTTVATTGTMKDFLLNLNGLFDKWNSENVDVSNRKEFTKFVFIFFFACIFYAFFNKFTGYDAANPGMIIYFLGALIFLGSMAAGFDCANNGCQGLFYYGNLFGNTAQEQIGQAAGFMNNYILAMVMFFLVAGYSLSVGRRNS